MVSVRQLRRGDADMIQRYSRQQASHPPRSCMSHHTHTHTTVEEETDLGARVHHVGLRGVAFGRLVEEAEVDHRIKRRLVEVERARIVLLSQGHFALDLGQLGEAEECVQVARVPP